MYQANSWNLSYAISKFRDGSRDFRRHLNNSKAVVIAGRELLISTPRILNQTTGTRVVTSVRQIAGDLEHDDFELGGLKNGFGPALGLKFFKYRGNVKLHRMKGNPKAASNFFVGKSIGHGSEYGDFPLR